MHIADAADSPAPTSDGPTVRKLVSTNGTPAVTLMHVTLAPGQKMREHDHGKAEVVLLPIDGHVRLSADGTEHELTPGSATYLAVGDRIGLANPSAGQSVHLVVTVIPPV